MKKIAIVTAVLVRLDFYLLSVTDDKHKTCLRSKNSENVRILKPTNSILAYAVFAQKQVDLESGGELLELR